MTRSVFRRTERAAASTTGSDESPAHGPPRENRATAARGAPTCLRVRALAAAVARFAPPPAGVARAGGKDSPPAAASSASGSHRASAPVRTGSSLSAAGPVGSAGPSPASHPAPITQAAPPQGAPFLWTQSGGMTNLASLGYPNEMPMAISRGGKVATHSRWYQLGDPASATTLAAPPSGYLVNNGAVSINDEGDQARFLVSLSGQNLVYFYRYLHGGGWQRLSNSGTGHLSTYGVGAIDGSGTVTGTVQSTGVVAHGPDGLASSLSPRISPAYPGAAVVSAGTIHASGVILARVLLGASSRLVRLVPQELGPAPRMRVASLSLAASFVPDPGDPTQDHCSPDLDAYNVALATAKVVDAAGAPLANARVVGRFLDAYWTDAAAARRTDTNGEVRFAATGPCGVGAITFFVDGVELAGFTLDKSGGVLVASAIPQ